MILKVEVTGDHMEALEERNEQKEFARTHRWRVLLGKRTILYVQSVKINKLPTWLSRGHFTLNMYGAFDEDLIYVLDEDHTGKDVRIELTDDEGNARLTFKLSKVKLEDPGYTHLDLDYTKTEIVIVPVVFSFKKIEVEDADL